MTGPQSLRAATGALALSLTLAFGASGLAQPGHGHEGGGGGGYHGGYGRPGPPGRGEGMARREPGGGYYGPPPSAFQAPRYAAPIPRRPYGAEPGWRPAPHTPPGIYGARTASLGWVVESIGRRTPGRVLDARVEDLAGRPVYRVVWLTVHGRRTEYVVDAATGAVLSGR